MARAKKSIKKQQNEIIARIKIRAEKSYLLASPSKGKKDKIVKGRKEQGMKIQPIPVITLIMPEKEYKERIENAIRYLKTGDLYELPEKDKQDTSQDEDQGDDNIVDNNQITGDDEDTWDIGEVV